MNRGRALYLCSSIEQAQQMTAIARELDELEPSFTPLWDARFDWARYASRARHREALEHREACLDWLARERLYVDDGGRDGRYDLVLSSTDLVTPAAARTAKWVVVQEGALDPEGLVSELCSQMRVLPKWLAGTTLTGTVGAYDLFCVASEGYRGDIVRRGGDPRKVIVTGIPRFDDCERARDNRLDRRNYVLVCTDDTRKKGERRARFFASARRIAGRRAIVVVLSPNADVSAARAEVLAAIPEALVLDSDSHSMPRLHELVANADVIVTERSNVALLATALRIEVHSFMPRMELQRLCPIQNGGSSAHAIAHACRNLLPGRTARSMPARTLVQSWRERATRIAEVA